MDGNESDLCVIEWKFLGNGKARRTRRASSIWEGWFRLIELHLPLPFSGRKSAAFVEFGLEIFFKLRLGIKVLPDFQTSMFLSFA